MAEAMIEVYQSLTPENPSAPANLGCETSFPQKE
jgi:hypothetical protein